VAIEAAGLADGVTCYAVERSETQGAMLRENVAASGLQSSVHVVSGEAPESLSSLPDPDAIFVAGSGGRLVEILNAGRARLRVGGRIVLNLVTYEHVSEVLGWTQLDRLQSELVQISVSRGADILGMTRLQAENPVTIVTILP
jgi:precorrin-6Y C5,15-methyltransferase (decarboxylating)